MIVVTGAGGFIGSAMIGYLNSIGRNDIIAVDDLPNPDQYKNLIGKTFTLVSSDEVAEFEQYGPGKIDCILHFGAISDTLANDWSQLYKQNVLSTRRKEEEGETKTYARTMHIIEKLGNQPQGVNPNPK